MSRRSGGKKFLPLSQEDIEKDKILLPGRMECSCEASKHNLINNCEECGRIVCEQEGSGPCFTCKSLVCTPKEKEVILRQSKTSFKLYTKLMGLENSDTRKPSSNNDSKLQSAIEHRNRLLEYDRTVEKRTKVIDDENDFFQVDSKWLSKKEKEVLTKKKEEVYDLMHNRQKQNFTFDFAGREIKEEKPSLDFDVDELLQNELLKEEISIFDSYNTQTSDIPSDLQHPVYYEMNNPNDYHPPISKESRRLTVRIQDKGLQEMSDEGYCLSLHQPYASLLSCGIKKHEGRTWYTSYRGRLWIHAAGKVPTKQEVQAIESRYKSNQMNCVFPKLYPTSCLLGCIDLVSCLPQDEYKTEHPQGESGDPYVFICENAQELRIKFPMKGKHKLFKLESNIHLAAKKILTKTGK